MIIIIAECNSYHHVVNTMVSYIFVGNSNMILRHIN